MIERAEDIHASTNISLGREHLPGEWFPPKRLRLIPKKLPPAYLSGHTVLQDVTCPDLLPIGS